MKTGPAKFAVFKYTLTALLLAGFLAFALDVCSSLMPQFWPDSRVNVFGQQPAFLVLVFVGMSCGPAAVCAALLAKWAGKSKVIILAGAAMPLLIVLGMAKLVCLFELRHAILTMQQASAFIGSHSVALSAAAPLEPEVRSKFAEWERKGTRITMFDGYWLLTKTGVIFSSQNLMYSSQTGWMQNLE